jgi:transglutaminase-like putative cysteine protease
MAILRVRHTTRYDYRVPVELGEHRLMMRPRDSHDLRLIDTQLTIDPATSALRWIHDVFGNSIALASFEGSTQSLLLTSEFRAEHYPAAPQELRVESYAERLPFSYSAAEAEDLGRSKERHYDDPEHVVDRWAQAQLARAPERGTLDVLAWMTRTIKEQFNYVPRDAPGTQSPLETLQQGSGSCRDFALLMMEAARSLGLAARFVSGYLYDERLVGAESGLVGSGATHAWLQVFLPGAGWVEYDPTNALIGGRNLIRVAVARDPSQAQPLTGSFTGPADAFIAMRVTVEVGAE